MALIQSEGSNQQSTEKSSDGRLQPEITSHPAISPRSVRWSSMKSSRSPCWLHLVLLSGCAAAERPALALAPDQVTALRIGRSNARPKTKIAKQPQPRRPAQPVSASAPTLPPWNVPSPKPTRIFSNTHAAANCSRKSALPSMPSRRLGKRHSKYLLTDRLLLFRRRKQSPTVTLSPVPPPSCSPMQPRHSGPKLFRRIARRIVASLECLTATWRPSQAFGTTSVWLSAKSSSRLGRRKVW